MNKNQLQMKWTPTMGQMKRLILTAGTIIGKRNNWIMADLYELNPMTLPPPHGI